MSVKDTFSSFMKMGRKDPLKMAFAIVLISVLPLLVVGTLTEVLLKSRAAYPISGATGAVGDRVKYFASFKRTPDCSGASCVNGKDVVIFYNSSNKILKNIRIEKILQYDHSTKAISNPQILKAFFTNDTGTTKTEVLDTINPGEQIYVGVESSKPLSMTPPVVRGEIFFTGMECITASNCSLQWKESSHDLLFDRFVTTLAPEVKNPLQYKDQNVSFSADSFVIKKNNIYYYGTKDNLSNNVEKVSAQEIKATTSWRENGKSVKLVTTLKRDASSWWIDSMTFNDGLSTLSTAKLLWNHDLNVGISEKQFSMGTNYYESLFMVLNLKILPNWGSVPSPTPTATPTSGTSNGTSSFDLNGDSILDLRDYTLMANNYGKNGAAKFVKADINGDGKVNKADMDLLISQIKEKKLQKIK